MLMEFLTSRRFWIFIVIAAVLYWFFRVPIRNYFLRIQTGKQAVADAAQLNGYTTYNTQLYSPPFWFPFLNFFKANPYVPVNQASTSRQTQYTTGNVQG